jgi:hypothetical protein
MSNDKQPSEQPPRPGGQQHRAEPAEDTSFSALSADMPEAPVEHEAVPDRMEEYGDLSPEDVLRLQEKAEVDERLNSRVLAAGSVERKPMHVSSLLLGALSLGMYWFSGGEGVLLYVVILVGLGGAAWGITGAFRSDDPGAQRGLCGAGAAMGALALLMSVLKVI